MSTFTRAGIESRLRRLESGKPEPVEYVLNWSDVIATGNKEKDRVAEADKRLLAEGREVYRLRWADDLRISHKVLMYIHTRNSIK